MHCGIELLDSGPFRSKTHETLGVHSPVPPVSPDSTAPPEGLPHRRGRCRKDRRAVSPPPEGFSDSILINPGRPQLHQATNGPTSSCHPKLHCAARTDEYSHPKASPRRRRFLVSLFSSMDTQVSLLLLLSVLSHLHLYQTLAVCQQYGCSLECSDPGVHFEIHGLGLLSVMGIRNVSNKILWFHRKIH
jgi:hypothetical protein